MESAFIGDPFSGDDTFMPSLHDDADLLHFLDGLDKHFAAPCPSDESSLEDMLKDTADRARMCGSRSLPDLPLAAFKGRPAELSSTRTMSSDFTAVSFIDQHRSLSRVSSDISYNQPSKPLAPPSEMSSSLITETWRGAEPKDQAVEPYLQHWDASWDHDHPGHSQSPQEWGTPSQDGVVPTAPATVGPNISDIPAARPGGAQRGRAKNTEGWRDKNRRIQKAFRERQKEKQRSTELAIEEMSEQVEALEAETRQLQKTLEDATHSVKRNKVAVKDCSGVAVAVTCSDGDAPVRLTSGDLQAFTIERMAHVWRGLVSNMAVCFPEAERKPQGPHAKRLEALAGEGCALMWGLVDLNPTVLASFVNCDLEAAAPRQNLSSDMWTSILGRLQLSAEQRAALAETRRAMLANVGALLAERKQLMAQAQGVTWVGGNGSLIASDLANMVEQAHSNIEAIHLCTAYYISHACIEILTPLQCARFFHQCYPFGPDLMSLMAAAAAAADEPRTADIFQAVRNKSGGFQASSEWRKALVLPLSRLRCADP